MAATIYFGLSLLLLGNTLGVLFPRLYGRRLGPLFSLGPMILALAIPQFIALGLLVTAIVAALGGLRVLLGQVGLLLHGLSWALLGIYLDRIARAYPVLDGCPVRDDDQPFCDGLTGDERAALQPGRVAWRPSLTHKVPAMLGVQVERGLVFHEAGGVRLRLDVYRPGRPGRPGDRPGDRPGPLPAAIYIHGGGWLTGNRRQSRFLMYELAAAGFAVFAISYRFAPRFPLPAAIIDCKAAVAWVRAHASEHGADPDRLLVLGGSAGGHLAAMLALSPNDPRFQPGFEAADTSVDGAVVFYGVPDFVSAFSERPDRGTALFLERLIFRKRYREDPEVFRAAQPMSYLSAAAPPILLVHGTHDALVPIEESRRFYRKLKEAGAREVHLLEVPLGLHAFEVMPTPLHQRTVRVIVRFLSALTRACPRPS